MYRTESEPIWEVQLEFIFAHKDKNSFLDWESIHEFWQNGSRR